MRREPEVTAQLIDSEAEQLLELAFDGRNKPNSRKIDVGRSIFYALAVDSYYDYVKNHPLTPEVVAKMQAEIEAEREAGTADDEYRPIPRVHDAPNEEYPSVIVLDNRRFTELSAIALVQESNLANALMHSAVHYFQLPRG